jgi:hypothetical protein
MLASAGDLTVTSGGGGDVTITGPAGAGSGDITDVFNCSSGDCASVTMADGDLLSAASINPNTISEGIILPQATVCTGATAEGQICWKTDTDNLYIGITGGVKQIDTVDTNANTLCAGTTTYLDGEGNCDDLSTVYMAAGTDNWVNTGGDTMTGGLTFNGVDLDLQAASGQTLTLSATGITTGTGIQIHGNSDTPQGAGHLVMVGSNPHDTSRHAVGSSGATILGVYGADSGIGNYTVLKIAEVVDANSGDILLDVGGLVKIDEDGLLTYSGPGRPKRTTILTASGALLDPSDGPTRTTTDGTNLTYVTLDFSSGSTTKTATWNFVVPDSFDAASPVNLAPVVYWLSDGASTTATWEVNIQGITDDGAVDTAAAGSASATCTASGTIGNLDICTLSSVASGWGDSEFAWVRVRRSGGTATTPKLLMVKLEWTASAESD